MSYTYVNNHNGFFSIQDGSRTQPRHLAVATLKEIEIAVTQGLKYASDREDAHSHKTEDELKQELLGRAFQIFTGFNRKIKNLPFYKRIWGIGKAEKKEVKTLYLHIAQLLAQPWEVLPQSIEKKIFKHLNIRSLGTMAQVSKRHAEQAVIFQARLLGHAVKNAKEGKRFLKLIEKGMGDILKCRYYIEGKEHFYVPKKHIFKNENIFQDRPHFPKLTFRNLLLNQSPELKLQLGKSLSRFASRWKDALKVLLFLEPDLDIFNEEGFSPIFIALKNNDPESIDLLIDAGANVNVQRWTGATPLIYALLYLNDEDVIRKIVIKLCKHGASNTVNQQDQYKRSALYIAAVRGMHTLIPILVQNGADTEIQDNSGRTPLFYASSEETVQALIACGAQLEAQDDVGNTPLVHSVYGSADVVKALLKIGANTQHINLDGDSALHRAVKANNLPIVKVLLEENVDLELPGNNGNTPLMEAVIGGHELIVHALVKAGARVNAMNNDGNTALLLSLFQNSKSIVQYLLENGADTMINHTNQDGVNALHIVSFSERLSNLVPLVLQHQPDLEFPDNDGNTALTLAVKQDCEIAVSLLVKAGANIRAQNHQGQMPVSLVIRKSQYIKAIFLDKLFQERL